MFEIEIPSGVEIKIEGDRVTVRGKNGSTTKRFNRKFVDVKVSNSKVIIDTTKEKKLVKSAALVERAFSTELRNGIEGAEKGVERKLQIVNAHFPISLEVKGDRILIKNMFGERYPRTVRIYGDTKIEVKGQEVRVKGADVYDVSQTIANIRKACSALGHDTRVFQDGLYIVKEE
jgi:large subunit ribosomal protein L6